MAALGQICIVGAFGLALYAIVSSVAGVRIGSRELISSGRNAAWAVTALITAASVTLLLAFAVHDFSLRYVWEHSSRAMSIDLVLAAFYSGQQGSLLYWAWTLSCSASWRRRSKRYRACRPTAWASIRCCTTRACASIPRCCWPD
jgi:cytochrome c-type biogenesis protein CcmF